MTRHLSGLPTSQVSFLCSLDPGLSTSRMMCELPAL